MTFFLYPINQFPIKISSSTFQKSLKSLEEKGLNHFFWRYVNIYHRLIHHWIFNRRSLILETFIVSLNMIKFMVHSMGSSSFIFHSLSPLSFLLNWNHFFFGGKWWNLTVRKAREREKDRNWKINYPHSLCHRFSLSILDCNLLLFDCYVTCKRVMLVMACSLYLIFPAVVS